MCQYILSLVTLATAKHQTWPRIHQLSVNSGSFLAAVDDQDSQKVEIGSESLLAAEADIHTQYLK